MAFKGHITLDGKEYLLTSLPQKTFVNQMAPAIGQGESKYQDGTSWAAWIQKDWQDGNGKLDPVEQAGFLYGEVESRVPHQLILPGKLSFSDRRTIDGTTADCRYVPTLAQGFFTNIAGSVYGTDEYNGIYIPFHTPATLSYIWAFWVYGSVPDSMTIPLEFKIFSNSAGSPGASLFSVGATYSAHNQSMQWVGGRFDNALGTLAVNTDYWLYAPTEKVAYGSSGYGTFTKGVRSGSYVSTSRYALYASTLYSLDASTGNQINHYGNGFFRFNGNLYCYTGIDEQGAGSNFTKLYKYSTVNSNWTVVGSIGSLRSVTSAVVFGDKVYFSGGLYAGESTKLVTMTTAEVLANGVDDASLLANYNGFLYKAYGNLLEYSNDGLTWEPTTTYGDPISVGSSEYDITGMAGMNGNFYVCTPSGLYQIADGGFSVPIAPWGSNDPLNGSRMVAFQGALYVTVGGRLVRFSSDGRFQDVWMTREDDLLSARVGRVYDICQTNNWLIAIVAQAAGSSAFVNTIPTIWALQGDSWHYISTLPVATNTFDPAEGVNYNVFYDRTLRKLWAITPSNIPFNVYVPDFTLNPFNDSSQLYALNGWIEWDWFDSPIFDVLKDYDSVSIVGENFSSDCYAVIYWKDDSSTVFEILGTISSNVSTLRWVITNANRPATRRFKLGILLVCPTGSTTPRIRAIRVKYLPMLRDWYQWNLQIDVSGTAAYPEEGVNGEVNTRTLATIHNDLQTVAKGIGTYLYTDIDGTQYEVKVKAANFPYSKFEYNRESGAKEYEGVWNFTLEQATTDPYPP